MLLRLWSDQPYRATRDLDLLRRGDGSFEAIRDDLRAIVRDAGPSRTPSVFDARRASGSRPIRAEDEYAGTRATLPARCGKARLTLQIDMGLGDAVWPAPQVVHVPDAARLPRAGGARLSARGRGRGEARGDGRARRPQQPHQGLLRPPPSREPLRVRPRHPGRGRAPDVRAAQHADSGGRPDRAHAGYWENPSRPAQVRAFARRAGLEVPAEPAEEFTQLLHAFLSPVLEDLRSGRRPAGTWPPGGPWQ